MTGGVFIEEGVVEEMAAPGDRRTGRDERHFSKAGRALIRVDQFLEDSFILFCADLDDFPVFKRYTEIFDQAAAITEWKGGMDGRRLKLKHGRYGQLNRARICKR